MSTTKKSVYFAQPRRQADISNKLKTIDKKIDEFDEFSESVKRVISNGGAGGNDESDEKYSLVVAEMHKLKNQVFVVTGTIKLECFLLQSLSSIV